MHSASKTAAQVEVDAELPLACFDHLQRAQCRADLFTEVQRERRFRCDIFSQITFQAR